MLVTVSSFMEPSEAHLFRGRLAAEGVFAVVSHETHVANVWGQSVALGGVKVQVSADQFETAREIERASWRGDYRQLLQEETGDLDDPICPYCGGTAYSKRRPFPRAVLAVAISLYLALVIPPLGWIHRCESCHREYRAPRQPFSVEKWLLAAVVSLAIAVAYLFVRHWLNRVFGCSSTISCF